MSGPPVSPPPPPAAVPDVASAAASTRALVERVEKTLARATSFSEDELQQGVNDEWSTVQSIRHLVLVLDLWQCKVIGGEKDPFHPFALPPHFMPPDLFPGSSIDPAARPSFAEACDVLRGRLDRLQSYIDGLTTDELARPIEGHAETVAGGLGVIFNEFAFHDHFVNRDLDVIEKART